MTIEPTDIGRWFITRTMDPEDPRALKMTPKLAIKGSMVTVLPEKKKKMEKINFIKSDDST